MDARTILRLAAPTAAVLAAWAVLGWTRPNGDIADAEARIETAEAAIVAGNAQLAASEGRVDEAEALTARLERYELAVPAEIDQAGLFRRFDALGEEYGVVLGSVQITEDESSAADTAAMAFTDPTGTAMSGGDAEVESGVLEGDATASTMPPMPGTTDATGGASLTLRVLRVNADVTGPYAQVLDFLDALRASPRLLVIDQLSVVPDSEDPSFVSVNVSLRAFAQPAPTAGATGDPMAGDPMAGDPMAGDPMAGDPMAGSAG